MIWVLLMLTFWAAFFFVLGVMLGRAAAAGDDHEEIDR